MKSSVSKEQNKLLVFLKKSPYWLRFLLTGFLFFFSFFMMRLTTGGGELLALIFLLFSLAAIVWTGIATFQKLSPSFADRKSSPRWLRILLFFTALPIAWMIFAGFGTSTALAIRPYSPEEIASQEREAAAEQAAAEQAAADKAAVEQAAAEQAAADKAAADKAAADKAAADKAAADKAAAEQAPKEQAPSGQQPAQESGQTWKPLGTFFEYLSPLKFTDCSFGGRCIEFNVKSLGDCASGVYFEAQTKDANGNVIGYTNASHPDLRAGQTAILEMPLTEPNVKSIALNDYQCFNY